MRIAQLAPLVERVPPKKYGGTERVVHALTEELVRRGHEVTLFATRDSQTTARLIAPYAHALRESRLSRGAGQTWTLLHIGLAYEMRKEFDIIYDHLVPHSMPTANLCDVPVVATIHGAFTTDSREMFKRLRSPNIVAISHAQARVAEGINLAGVVYNGLALGMMPFGETPGDYLLYVGCLSMEKGVHHAIENFSTSRMTDGYEQIYRCLTGLT